MSLISRYIFREAFGASVIVLSVLLLIMMSNQFAVILGDAAANRLPKDAVFAVFALNVLSFVTLLAPISLFLGVMLALARLNRDSEMAALSACGIGPVQLLKPVGVLTLAAAAVVAWLALVQTPHASRRIEQIKFAASGAMKLAALEPGKFTTPDNGRTWLYAREVNGNELHDVFLEREEDGHVVVILAARGERVEDPANGRLSFVLYQGKRYDGVPGRKSFSIAQFGEQGIPIRRTGSEFTAAVAGKPTSALLASADPTDRAELQWRLSTPISLLVLALLAIPLSRSSPREGRFARMGTGLLIYVIYANLLSVAQVWVQRGQTPTWAGMWVVHAAAGLLAVLLICRDAGLFAGRVARPRIEPVYR